MESVTLLYEDGHQSGHAKETRIVFTSKIAEQNHHHHRSVESFFFSLKARWSFKKVTVKGKANNKKRIILLLIMNNG